MSRLLGILTFAGLLMCADAALAKKHHDPGPKPEKHPTSVPELSAAGATAGLVVVGGAAAILLGRRRARKS